MRKYNLILSGGGAKSYAHLGVYKYCFENGIQFEEITAISGGSIVAPFICLRKEPDELIKILKKAKIHNLLFPIWFVPQKFEILITQPSTYKLGEWVEEQIKQFPSGLEMLKLSNKLHIMATKNPLCGVKALFTDMLKITDLKNSIAASTAISGIFKDHKVGDCSYLDGGHWNNCPIFFDFKENSLPLLVSNLGYTGLVEKEGGRISKIMRGLEISSFARVQEDIVRWDFEKTCNKRGDLFVVNPAAWNIHSLDFNLKDSQMDILIDAGYKAAKIGLKKNNLAVSV